MIALKVASVITHKKAESIDDCQDAIKVNQEESRYAVADGATRSFFPKQWAELLVERFCDMPDLSLDAENWKQWLVPIQEKWYKQVEERVKVRDQFYLTNSLNTREPAVATFVGLEIEKPKREWRAMIVGDSCLFHKSEFGFRSYLLEKSEDFTSQPEAFASYAEGNHYDPEFIRGEIQSGDLFILATDALAKWILEHKESGNLEAVLNRLGQIETPEQFNLFVDRAREEDIRLVNDDVALLLISVEDSEVTEIREDEQEITSDEIRENEQEIPSDTQTPENIESQASVLEIALWGSITGLFGLWTFYWMYRFLRDLILMLTE